MTARTNIVTKDGDGRTHLACCTDQIAKPEATSKQIKFNKSDKPANHHQDFLSGGGVLYVVLVALDMLPGKIRYSYIRDFAHLLFLAVKYFRKVIILFNAIEGQIQSA